MGSSSSVSSQEHLPQGTLLDNEKENAYNIVRKLKMENEAKSLNEFDVYKREKENEIKSLKKEITKLETDGKRLRDELKSMEKKMTRLKNESETEISATNKQENVEIKENTQQIHQLPFDFDSIEKTSNFKYSLPEILRSRDSKRNLSSSDNYLCLDSLEDDSFHASMRLIRESPNVQWIPEKCIRQLTKYVSSNSISTPLLIRGVSGFGKSLLTTYWISTLPKEYFVLHHSVVSENSVTANPDFVFSKFTVKILDEVGFVSCVSSNPLKLRNQFSHLLAKCSEKFGERVVLVFDSADKFENIELLSWLLDPILEKIRVVVTVDTHNCPSAWKTWPSIHLEPLTKSSIRAILSTTNVLQRNEVNSISDQLSLSAQTSCPLYIKVLHGALNKWRHKSSTKFYNRKTLVELYAKILKKLLRSSQITSNILQFVWFSPDGISRDTTLYLVNPKHKISDENFRNILRDLESLHIINVNSVNHVISLPNECVKAAFLKLPADLWSPSSEKLISIIKFYKNQLKRGEISSEVCIQLPKFLIQVKRFQEARNIISNVRVFFYLYTRGKTWILLEFWTSIGITWPKMADIYLKSKPTDANILEALGIFLRDLDLYEKSFIALQRCLETRETSLDPDDVLLGHSFHQLAGLFYRWDKMTPAETYYKQALEIYETNHEENHFLIKTVIQGLINTYKKENK